MREYPVDYLSSLHHRGAAGQPPFYTFFSFSSSSSIPSSHTQEERVEADFQAVGFELMKLKRSEMNKNCSSDLQKSTSNSVTIVVFIYSYELMYVVS